ncbi:N-acetylmuramoyl-L-alanine amidase [Sutcliffiella horikoshii]|uniref:N-acetylmuramoyl-L-alanine amidase n=1 Tax=Sutcliffiella horikoshii TaxID=79883 RepID=A0A5D4S5B3_9BACI|nr:N-acetylmuramoyl-L-alanine amidase [Sutcliffiella horikoshii]TYS58400.1 N-acetylmuramoyl-L-alanine amidase [Sutcliffiella horikoshii]
MNVGKYLNLMPHMTSWRVYILNTSPTTGNEVGMLAPASFGGLSYRILSNPSTDLYTIRTESFGTVNIYAPQDPDSSITNVARFENDSALLSGQSRFLNLQPHMASWRVYPLGVNPVSGNEVGSLAPSTFGGLSYRIIDEPSTDLFSIHTESFGKVNIFAPPDPDSSITSTPQFSNGGDVGSTGISSGQFLNLLPHMSSWRVYPLGVSTSAGNEVGQLAPSRFGGLSYEILGNPTTNVYTILTESFGKVNIFAPADNDSSFSTYPVYLGSSDGSSGATHGNYLNLMPHISSWRVYPLGVPLVAGNEVGRLAPSRYGGLSYRILGTTGVNSYTISTESFGRVNIFAPRDEDSQITAIPLFGEFQSTPPSSGSIGIPIVSNPNGVKVFLDAGHGGSDPGASGNGLIEKSINLEITLKVGEILSQHGANVRFRRTGDSYSSLDNIVYSANSWGANLFVSIHGNALNNSSVRGTEVFTYNDTPATRNLAANVARSISNNLGIPNRGAKEDNFRVITYTTMPSILVETAFLSNSNDAYLLKTRADDFARAIANEIIVYLGLNNELPELTPLQKSQLIREKRIELLQNLKESPLIKDVLPDYEILNLIPSGEFWNDKSVTRDYGHMKVTITCASLLKTPGNEDSVITIRNGEVYDGAIKLQLDNDINEFQNILGLEAEVGTGGFFLHNKVNNGEIITSSGMNLEGQIVLKLTMNMRDFRIQGELKSSLAVTIEVVMDQKHPKLSNYLSNDVLKFLAGLTTTAVVSAYSYKAIMENMGVIVRTAPSRLLYLTSSVLDKMNEEFRKYQPY